MLPQRSPVTPQGDEPPPVKTAYSRARLLPVGRLRVTRGLCRLQRHRTRATGLSCVRFVRILHTAAAFRAGRPDSRGRSPRPVPPLARSRSHLRLLESDPPGRWRGTGWRVEQIITYVINACQHKCVFVGEICNIWLESRVVGAAIEASRSCDELARVRLQDGALRRSCRGQKRKAPLWAGLYGALSITRWDAMRRSVAHDPDISNEIL